VRAIRFEGVPAALAGNEAGSDVQHGERVGARMAVAVVGSDRDHGDSRAKDIAVEAAS